ncbi:MAG: chromatin protein Cren7 [Acidilobaceae archaeon]
MARTDPFRCPSCGTKAKSPLRTWTLTSPFPDKYGRLTVTVMGSFVCDSCGASWNAVIKKMKVGEEREVEREEPHIITIDLNELKD